MQSVIITFDEKKFLWGGNIAFSWICIHKIFFFTNFTQDAQRSNGHLIRFSSCSESNSFIWYKGLEFPSADFNELVNLTIPRQRDRQETWSLFEGAQLYRRKYFTFLKVEPHGATRYQLATSYNQLHYIKIKEVQAIIKFT